jgi:hypothetical protein
MSPRSFERAAIVLVIASALVACGKSPVANDVAAASGAPTVSDAPRPSSAAYSADASKTGEAYADELEHNPGLYEKQKEICHGNGPSFQPSPELQGPCAAWDIARRNLEVDESAHQGGVKNTDSL